jgi:hypothetical protein
MLQGQIVKVTETDGITAIPRKCIVLAKQCNKRSKDIFFIGITVSSERYLGQAIAIFFRQFGLGTCWGSVYVFIS